MSRFTLRRTAAAAALALLLVPPVFAAKVAGLPFPSNAYTVFDAAQNTLRRVVLPKPDCSVRPSDCQDIDVINTLDGFSTQPRITVTFDADIDLTTVTSDTMYLTSLGDPLSGAGAGERVGINQVAWDTATRTLAVESDQLLREHTRYLLVLTNGIRSAAGQPLEAADLYAAGGVTSSRNLAAYRVELRDAVQALPATVRPVAASVFVTQSATTELAKINAQIKSSTPAPVDFNIGSTAAGTVRALFPIASVTGIQFNRQTGTAPTFTASAPPLAALGIAPGAIGSIAYGRYRSPDYETPQRYIPPTSTLLGAPAVQGQNDLIVQIFLPAGTKPAGGWPVAIFGHGFGDSMYGAPWTVASVLAAGGMAVASINVVGHGGGAAGALSVQRSGGAATVTVPAGGRGIDQDGNGTIDSTEGVNALAPRGLISSRDGLRQTTIDLMQLVRQIEAGIDIDGDASVDLNPQRIYYAGQSFGGIYGTILLGTEPSLKAGVPNVPGGSITEVARLGGFRPLTALALDTRLPSLINLAPLPGVPYPNNLQFNENIPLRNQPPLTNTVAGAFDIAQFLDRSEWVTQSGNPVSYAPNLKARGTPVIFQFAKGDQTVPNPTTTAILRAGDFGNRATYFRNDLAYAANTTVGKNPHAFISNIASSPSVNYAVAAQQQIATFFATNGTTIIDPDGAGPYFETPIVGALPEVLNFIP